MRTCIQIQLELVIIYFYPIAIRILKVNLVYLIWSNLNLFWISSPVAIFNIEPIESFHKCLQIRNGKCKMNIDIMRYRFFGSADYMELAMFADLKPYVTFIVEWFRNSIQQHHFFIKLCAACEVRYINRQMIKLWLRLGPALKG